MNFLKKMAVWIVPFTLTMILAWALPLPAAAGGPGDDDSDSPLFSQQGGGRSQQRARQHAGYRFPPKRDYRFLTIQVGTRSMGGDDFDGETFYSGENDLFLVPKMNDATFYGVYMEFRNGPWGGGFGYSRASHDWSFAGASAEPADATSHFIDFDFRGYALPRSPIQPFLLLGFSFNGIRVEDGKVDLVDTRLDNLSMWGLGLNYGAGVDYYLGRRLKVTGGARWHLDGYNSISGNDLDEGLTCSGVNYYVSVGLGLDH